MTEEGEAHVSVAPDAVEPFLRNLFSDPAIITLPAIVRLPLARLIARCALARTESRGAHRRSDHPERDPALDHRHVVVAGEEDLAWQTWT